MHQLNHFPPPEYFQQIYDILLEQHYDPADAYKAVCYRAESTVNSGCKDEAKLLLLKIKEYGVAVMFPWAETPEGFDYWQGVELQAIARENELRDSKI